MAKAHDLAVSGTFILGVPTESEAKRRAVYKLACHLDLDVALFNNVTPYPGTQLGWSRTNPVSTQGATGGT